MLGILTVEKHLKIFGTRVLYVAPQNTADLIAQAVLSSVLS